jgi:hypothetical protein
LSPHIFLKKFVIDLKTEKHFGQDPWLKGASSAYRRSEIYPLPKRPQAFAAIALPGEKLTPESDYISPYNNVPALFNADAPNQSTLPVQLMFSFLCGLTPGRQISTIISSRFKHGKIH